MLLAGSLKPNESLTQLVSGLIVVLTFTLAASVATGGGQQVVRSGFGRSHRGQRLMGHHIGFSKARSQPTYQLYSRPSSTS